MKKLIIFIILFTAACYATQSNFDVFRAGDGSLSLPAYQFNSDSNTGIFRKGADNIAISVGGVEALDITNNNLTVSDFNVGNLDMNGNTLSSTSGNLILTPTSSLVVNDASIGTAGDVLTSSDTIGTVIWQTPSSGAVAATVLLTQPFRNFEEAIGAGETSDGKGQQILIGSDPITVTNVGFKVFDDISAGGTFTFSVRNCNAQSNSCLPTSVVATSVATAPSTLGGSLPANFVIIDMITPAVLSANTWYSVVVDAANVTTSIKASRSSIDIQPLVNGNSHTTGGGWGTTGTDVAFELNGTTGSANTYMSNLNNVEINVPLEFGFLINGVIRTQDNDVGATKSLTLETGVASSTQPSGNLIHDTGDQDTATVTTQNSGDQLYRTGDVTNANNDGDSGSHIFDTGTVAGGGVQGNIQFLQRVVIGSTIPSTFSTLKIVTDDGNAIAISRFSNTASSGPRLRSNRARGTEATPLAVLASDRLFTIQSRGFEGVSNGIAAEIRFIADENWDGSSNGAHMAIRITENGTSSTVERWRFDHNGNLGIGESNPLELLHLTGGNILVGDGNVELQRASGNFGGNVRSGVTTSNVGFYYATAAASQACDTTCPNEDANAGFGASSGACLFAWTSAAVISTCATAATDQKCFCLGAN